MIPLLNGNLDAWLTRNAPRPGDLWVFLHIPKTAGSSFRQELANRLRPEANIVGSHADDGRPQIEKTREALAAFLERHARQPHRFASGHLRRHDLASIQKAHADTRFITMLREPVARAISDYRYMRTPAHPTWQQVIERYPTVEHYLRDPKTQDKMFRFLRRRPTDTAAEVIEDLEKRFSFVGTLEHYDLGCRALFRLLGGGASPALHERKTEARQDNAIADIDAARQLAAELNPVDQAIWQHFDTRWRTAAPRLERALAVSAEASAAGSAG